MDHSTYEVRLAQWAQIVKASNERPKGELLKDWLDANGISKDKYYYWQRKVRSEAYNHMQLTNASNNKVTFAELPIPDHVKAESAVPVINHPVAVIRYAGVTIQVSNDISETMLKVLLKEASHA